MLFVGRSLLSWLWFEHLTHRTTQVQVIDFKERPSAKDYVQIVISVENESQKPILLGKKGSALKQLATSARIDIEDFLGAHYSLKWC